MEIVGARWGSNTSLRGPEQESPGPTTPWRPHPSTTRLRRSSGDPVASLRSSFHLPSPSLFLLPSSQVSPRIRSQCNIFVVFPKSRIDGIFKVFKSSVGFRIYLYAYYSRTGIRWPCMILGKRAHNNLGTSNKPKSLFLSYNKPEINKSEKEIKHVPGTVYSMD